MKEEEVQAILAYNLPEFNYIKLAEELAELQEVVIKRYLKKEKNKPPLSKIIEEMGDCLVRFKILATMEGIREGVNDRVKEKTEKLLAYIKNKEFKGGV